MKTNISIKDIDSKTLRRYLETRKLIDERADRISNISYILSLFNHCGDPVSSHSLAFLFDMINFDICKIIESLDDFIYILDAESVLDKSDDGDVQPS